MSEPLLVQKLNAQMSYLTQRQGVLAQNIANVDTPGYHAQDLKKLNFDDLVRAQSTAKLSMATTSANDLAPPEHGGPFLGQKQNDTTEAKPNGNNVILEDQLGKVSDVGALHQLTTSLLHKYNQLYATALDSHGS